MKKILYHESNLPKGDFFVNGHTNLYVPDTSWLYMMCALGRNHPKNLAISF